MKGKVLGFDAAAGTGAINGENGQRYNFTAGEFKSPTPAKAGDNVDFEADGANAKNIYVTAGAMPNVDLGALTSNATVANRQIWRTASIPRLRAEFQAFREYRDSENRPGCKNLKSAGNSTRNPVRVCGAGKIPRWPGASPRC